MHEKILLCVFVMALALATTPAAAQQDVVVEMRHAAQQYTTNGCLSSAGSATFIISPPVQGSLLPTEMVATTDSGTKLHARIEWRLDAGEDMLVWEQYIPASVVEIRFSGGPAAVRTRTTTLMWRGLLDVFQRTAEVRCFNFLPLLLTR